ncbi:hypothetical protein GN244_ATG01976 [Phytophthora infestans]|uniref:CCHC-type domain-containing protein n=1 Tax=Phytophthora infestans TaxID=4787 RepID=A0A833WPL1_PHYIN|nr:hypothetical protein GN244_ATG01976 [Phytophthora infestans]
MAAGKTLPVRLRRIRQRGTAPEYETVPGATDTGAAGTARARPGTECFYCGREGHFGRGCRLKQADMAAGQLSAGQNVNEGPGAGNAPRAKGNRPYYSQGLAREDDRKV